MTTVRTHCIRGHEWTDANTYVGSNGRRNCRRCRTERERRPQAEGWLVPGATPDRIVEWLAMDGGWLTALSIATDLAANLGTVDRALWRLHKRKLVINKTQPHGRTLLWKLA